MNDLATPAVNRHLSYGALLFVVCILTGGVLIQLLSVQVDRVGLLVICLSALFVASLVFIVVQVQVTTAVNASGSIGRFLWWLLIVSQAAFVRYGPLEAAAEGKFSLAAYGEMAVWVAASALLVFYSLRNPRYLSGLFSRSYKWVSLYAILSVLSCSFSPRPVYSLVWAFKLCLVIILLKMLSDGMHKNDDLRAFLGATSAGIWVLVLAPFAQVLVDPELPFQEGRLGGMFAPTGVSEHAGILILLLLTFHALERRGWLVCPIVLASTILILGGGKVAIAATILSTTLFLLGQKKIIRAFLLFALICGLAVTAVTFFPPLVRYRHTYARLEHASTLTGRTPVWAAASNAIKESPLWGHGYMSSKFSSLSLQFSGVGWSAGNMHNAFLEALYNNGVLGLILVLLMNSSIVRNIIHILRQQSARSVYILAMALLALYAQLFLNGLFAPSFGGRPGSSFMVFLALVVMSEAKCHALTCPPKTSPAKM